MEQFGEEAGKFMLDILRPRCLGANCLVGELPPSLCSSPGLWAQGLHLVVVRGLVVVVLVVVVVVGWTFDWAAGS